MICAEALSDTFVRVYRDFQFILSSIVKPKIHKLCARIIFLWIPSNTILIFFKGLMTFWMKPLF